MNLRYLMMLFVLGLFISCSENDKSTTDPEEVDVNYSEKIAELFPVNVGSSFTYNIEELNKSTGNYETVGTRVMNVDTKEVDSEVNYFYCSEAYSLITGNLSLNSKFRITDNALEVYQDTSGVSTLIPDSLKALVQLQLSENLKIINYPYEDGEEWVAYKGETLFGTIKFNIYSVIGKYVGSENIETPINENGIEAEKFEYKITINIPDMNNPFLSNLQEYFVNLWMVKSVGIVKIEGCGVLINNIAGKTFNLSDSNKVFRHTLVGAQ